jgi:hypothetical protein
VDALSKVGFGTAAALFGWACWLGHPSWFSAGMAGLITVGMVPFLF